MPRNGPSSFERSMTSFPYDEVPSATIASRRGRERESQWAVSVLFEKRCAQGMESGMCGSEQRRDQGTVPWIRKWERDGDVTRSGDGAITVWETYCLF